jgi:hypothetical protein
VQLGIDREHDIARGCVVADGITVVPKSAIIS